MTERTVEIIMGAVLLALFAAGLGIWAWNKWVRKLPYEDEVKE